jgi:hypothetical protein
MLFPRCGGGERAGRIHLCQCPVDLEDRRQTNLYRSAPAVLPQAVGWISSPAIVLLNLYSNMAVTTSRTFVPLRRRDRPDWYLQAAGGDTLADHANGVSEARADDLRSCSSVAFLPSNASFPLSRHRLPSCTMILASCSWGIRELPR